MGHRDDCCSPEYSRQRGYEDRQSGWYSPYAMGDCDESQRAYDEGARQHERQMERRRQEREAEEAAEMEYYQRAQEEEELRRAEEAHWQQLQEQEWLASIEPPVPTPPSPPHTETLGGK